MNSHINSNFTQCKKFNSIKILNFDLTVTVKLCDLLKEETNVIVNASNSYLFLGEGISGAIRQKGGKSIQEELNNIRSKKSFIPEGGVEMTNTGLINNKNLCKLFHAVGPRYSTEKNNDELLGKAFYNCLRMADQNGFNSISIPPISSGIFGYPIKRVSIIFYKVIFSYISEKMKNSENFFLKDIYYCNNEERGYNVMMENLVDFKESLCKLGLNIQVDLILKNDVDMEIQSQFPVGDFNPEEYERNNMEVDRIINKNKSKYYVTEKNQIKAEIKKDINMKIDFRETDYLKEDSLMETSTIYEMIEKNMKVNVIESNSVKEDSLKDTKIMPNILEKKKAKLDKTNFKITDYFHKK